MSHSEPTYPVLQSTILSAIGMCPLAGSPLRAKVCTMHATFIHGGSLLPYLAAKAYADLGLGPPCIHLRKPSMHCDTARGIVAVTHSVEFDLELECVPSVPELMLRQIHVCAAIGVTERYGNPKLSARRDASCTVARNPSAIDNKQHRPRNRVVNQRNETPLHGIEASTRPIDSISLKADKRNLALSGDHPQKDTELPGDGIPIASIQKRRNAQYSNADHTDVPSHTAH